MTMVMLVVDLAVSHEIVLIAAGMVDLHQAMVTMGDVGEEGFTHIHDVLVGVDGPLACGGRCGG